jgi:hemerythrin
VKILSDQLVAKRNTMEILRWDKTRFSVGDENIDDQHKMLFNFVNYLITCSGKTYRRNEMEEVIEELIAYCDYHFTAEEELLQSHPEIDRHRKAHAEFVDAARHFQEKFKKGTETVNSELFTFLVIWIREHLLETDVVFFDELREYSRNHSI